MAHEKYYRFASNVLFTLPICANCSIVLMKRSRYALIILSSFLAPNTSAAGAEWQTFTLVESGLKVDIPISIFTEEADPADRVGGRTFRTRDHRADLTIKAMPNPANDPPAVFLEKLQPPARMQYRRTTPAFFAASSIKDGRTWYNRCNRAPGFMNCVLINYPAAEERQWDAVVTRVSLSLAK
jgi:hypothetical protein